MPREAPKSEEPKIPEWVLTYADMISLLVTFFIMLMTYSSMEKEQYAKMAGSMAGAFGVISDPRTPERESLQDPPPSIDNRVSKDGLRSSRKDLDRIHEQAKTLVRKPGVGNYVDFERLKQGLRIRITTETTFATASADLNSGTRRALREVADLLRIHSHRFVVVGHAWAEGETPEMTALSGRRALAAAEYLTGIGRVPERRLSIAARGDSEPVEARMGRAAANLNRRLEILVMPKDRE